jgi:hypothetical protein
MAAQFGLDESNDENDVKQKKLWRANDTRKKATEVKAQSWS